MRLRSRFTRPRFAGQPARLAATLAVGLAVILPAAGCTSGGAASVPGGTVRSSVPDGSATPGIGGRAARASWVATWAAAPMAATDSAQAERGFDGQTIRDIIYTSVGGTALRIRLSNLFGTRPLTIGLATVAAVLDGGALVPGSGRPLTFGGRPDVTIPAGATATSDPVVGAVAPLTDLAISLYLPTPTGPATNHAAAGQTSYLATGDRVGDPAGAGFRQRLPSWYYATEVDVWSATAAGTIVAFGDSITDGVGSESGADGRWPNDLARRVDAAYGDRAPGVVDEGIGGNRVLDGSRCFGQSALARFDRDALSVSGVRAVILLEGINDIGFAMDSVNACTLPVDRPMSAGKIEAGYRQLIAMAHAAGIKVYLGTLTPAPDRQPLRAAVNSWILTNQVADGVIDFAAATSDPADPRYYQPADNSGDNLHPNDLGYQMMASAIPLGWFR